MSQEQKFPWKKYLICTCVALVIVLFTFILRKFSMKTAKDWMHALHDGFFAAGAFLMLFFGLLYVSSEGMFLGVGYIMGRLVHWLLPFLNKGDETYSQYRERKTSKPKKKGDGAIFFVGLIFFAISLIFLLIWYQI